MTKHPTSWQTIKLLLTYLTSYKTLLIFALIFTMFSTILQVITPTWMGKILNHLQLAVKNENSVDFSYILRTALTLAAFYGALALFNIVVERSLVYLSQSLIKRLRSEVSYKIKKIPLAFFDQHSTGDLLSRITNDVDTVGRNVQSSVSQIFSSVLLLVGIVFMMLRISPILSLIFFVTMPLNVIATK